tara:strand:- start:139 stop:663 length:525 start_codon:yes stop_codon:yes gene_type:complete
MLKSLFNRAEKRLNEEELYAAVAIEIGKGVKREGIWAKAFAKAKGDENLTKAYYIELRVQSLRDEITTYAKELKDNAMRANEAQAQAQARAKANLAKKPELAPDIQKISDYCKSQDTFMIIRNVKKLGYNVTTVRPDKGSHHETFKVQKPGGEEVSFVGVESFISFIREELIEV